MLAFLCFTVFLIRLDNVCVSFLLPVSPVVSPFSVLPLLCVYVCGHMLIYAEEFPASRSKHTQWQSPTATGDRLWLLRRIIVLAAVSEAPLRLFGFSAKFIHLFVPSCRTPSGEQTGQCVLGEKCHCLDPDSRRPDPQTALTIRIMFHCSSL